MYIQIAFDEVCKDAKPAHGFYVCLMERVSFYGGPEEGGWWGADTHIAAYQYFPTEEQARAAQEQISKLAYELEQDARKQFGEACLNEMEWLEARGLDADYLPEPDGPSEFYVIVSEGLPKESRGCRHYE